MQQQSQFSIDETLHHFNPNNIKDQKTYLDQIVTVNNRYQKDKECFNGWIDLSLPPLPKDISLSGNRSESDPEFV